MPRSTQESIRKVSLLHSPEHRAATAAFHNARTKEWEELEAHLFPQISQDTCPILIFFPHLIPALCFLANYQQPLWQQVNSTASLQLRDLTQLQPWLLQLYRKARKHFSAVTATFCSCDIKTYKWQHWMKPKVHVATYYHLPG